MLIRPSPPGDDISAVFHTTIVRNSNISVREINTRSFDVLHRPKNQEIMEICPTKQSTPVTSGTNHVGIFYISRILVSVKTNKETPRLSTERKGKEKNLLRLPAKEPWNKNRGSKGAVDHLFIKGRT
jgi:hypothetical protein